MINESNFNPNQFEKNQLRADISHIEIGKQKESHVENLDESPDSLWVDFLYGDDPEKGIKSPGPETYVISPVSEQNLFSDKYLNCTGTVGIGRDKVSGKEIAFISHQDPEFFIHKGDEERAHFINDFKATLEELRARSEDGTIEVVVFGGNDDPADLTSKKSVDYATSIEILNKIVEESLGCTPTIIEGPNHTGGAIDVTVLTQERKISIGR